jgi:vanillate O-demethylase monooxygenase subunit
VAAWEEEIEGTAFLARTLLDESKLIYRREDGSGYAMVSDRCPHRFAPLHKGRREGDTVICPYHGLGFDASGACVRNPHGPVPRIAKLTATPVVARHGLLWFWPGDPALADPREIPDFSFLDGQDVYRRHSQFTGNYELVTDNLMDLGHVDHLHAQTFNTGGAHARAKQDVKDGEAGSIWSNWTIRDVPRFPGFDAVFPPGEPIDERLEMRWQAPASMMLRIRWMLSGRGVDEARHTVVNPHIITPETATTSHYFWTCDPTPQSEAFARAVFDGEDKPMIEAVQRSMGDADFWDLKPIMLKGDAGAVLARRRLAKLRETEAGAAKAAAPPVPAETRATS